MTRYLVKINEREYDITLEYRSEKFHAVVNGKDREVESHRLSETRSVVLIDNESNEIDVSANGYDNQRMVFVRGLEFPAEIEQYNLAQLRKTAGMSSAVKINKFLHADMPGLVVDVKVQPGDSVTKGEPLIIVEAMKMENVIKAPGDAVIKSVTVSKGKSVEKNDKLLEFEL